MIQTYVLLGTLGVHSIEDIKQKEITVTITLFSGIVGVVLHLLFQNQSIYDMLAGVLPGIFLLVLCRLTGGKIGMGDGIVFMLTGLYLGLFENLILMFLSFLLAGVCGLFLSAIRHCGRTEKLPLIPFLFLGYSLMLFW